jgi:hypothetical protein
MHLKSVGYTNTVLFLTIGNAVNVLSPDIGKQWWAATMENLSVKAMR